MLCYFAEPIDFDSMGPEELALRERTVKALIAAGHVVYRPATAWGLDKDPTKQESISIERVNREALAATDFMVARLPESTVTHGVPMEIEAATRSFGKPAVVIGVGRVALRANPNVVLVSEDEVDGVDWQIGAELLRHVRFDANVGHIRYSAPAILKQAHDNDAGIDLPASKTVLIEPGSARLIPTGIHIEIPPGYFGWVVARSSTFRITGGVVLPGVIDESYQGEIMVHLLNTMSTPWRVMAGDRVGQMLMIPNGYYGRSLHHVPATVIHATESTRGKNGFGSSGR